MIDKSNTTQWCFSRKKKKKEKGKFYRRKSFSCWNTETERERERERQNIYFKKDIFPIDIISILLCLKMRRVRGNHETFHWLIMMSKFIEVKSLSPLISNHQSNENILQDLKWLISIFRLRWGLLVWPTIERREERQLRIFSCSMKSD